MATAGLLEVDQLRVRYRNGAIGISDVSLRVDPGQVVAVFGPNGAGKTSTVRGISGFLKTEGARIVHGSVRFDGADVTNREPHRQAKRGVAFVPERDKVFPTLSVAENLAALGVFPAPGRQQELLTIVFDLFPVLADRRRELAGRLSGGQRQMLALARAILSDPRLLIIDEMTLGLHHSMQPVLYDAVRTIAATGTSLLLVDESTGFALEVADYCYLLTAGVVVDQGPAEKFRGNELLAAGYLEAEPCR
jgi:branched-chain amino acid transport system ATP-binding protein